MLVYRRISIINIMFVICNPVVRHPDPCPHEGPVAIWYHGHRRARIRMVDRDSLHEGLNTFARHCEAWMGGIHRHLQAIAEHIFLICVH